MNQETKHSLVEQDVALEVYLQNLLGESNPALPTVQAEPDRAMEKVAELIAQVPEARAMPSVAKAAPIKETKPVVTSSPVIEIENPTIRRKVEQAVSEVVKPAAKTDIPLPPEGGIPAWAQGTSGFQCLFFEVAGLVLAVPLIHLGGIHRLQNLNHLVGKPKWFKGMMRTENDDNINVVDTARWIMPEQYSTLEAKLKYDYVILLNKSPWGLACTHVSEAITIYQDDVKWRLKAGKRPWLAGMVKDRMCVLLDVHRMILLLDNNQG